MATPRKDGGSRRVGFTLDGFGCPISDARDGVWTDDSRAFARWVFLHELARRKLAVLGTHGGIDEDEIGTWARECHLVSTDPADDWPRAYAIATLRAWARYPAMRGRCWFDRDDTTGVLVPDNPATYSRPLKNAEHFAWLAAWQTGATWQEILDGAPAVTAIKTIRDAAEDLAARLALELRRGRRVRRKARQ